MAFNAGMRSDVPAVTPICRQMRKPRVFTLRDLGTDSNGNQQSRGQSELNGRQSIKARAYPHKICAIKATDVLITAGEESMNWSNER